MRTSLSTFGAIFCIAVTAAPSQAQNVEACVQMQSSLQRLDCYDSLFRGKLTAPAETKTSLTPSSVAKAVSPVIEKQAPAADPVITNSTGKTAKIAQPEGTKPDRPQWALRKDGDLNLVSAQSQRVHRNLVGHKSRLSLEVYCKDNTTSIRLTFGGNIVASYLDSARLRFTIDDKPPAQYEFAISDDFKSVGLWSGKEAIPIIKSLLDARTLTVEGAPFFARPVKTAFQVHGLNKAIQPVRGSCRW